MNDRAKLDRIRDLVKSKMMELPPFAGEEMNLPHNNPRHDGFVDGERTLAAQVIRILDEGAHNVAITNPREVDAVPREEEMVLGR